MIIGLPLKYYLNLYFYFNFVSFQWIFFFLNGIVELVLQFFKQSLLKLKLI